MAEKRYMNEAAENIRNKLTEIRRQGYREDPSDTPPLLYLSVCYSSARIAQRIFVERALPFCAHSSAEGRTTALE